MKLSGLPMAALIFGVFLFLPVNSPAQVDIVIDMSNLGKAWQSYTGNPTSENAQKVYEILPDRIQNRQVRLQVEVREVVSQGLSVLESQIFSGDRISLRIAFRLLTIADTSMAEELAKILGNLIRFNCRMFLQELKTHRHLVTDLSLITCSFQLTQPGDKAAQELEKKTRLKALDYIEDEDLKEINKECAKTLKKCKIK